MNSKDWATIRDHTAPRVRATIDAAFAKTPDPAPYDILNCADAKQLEHAYWALAVFGLLPIDYPPPGHFPFWDVSKPGRRVVLREHVHAEHYALFVETRPAGWVPAAEIVE